ncbi:MAG: radical SAM protein [bacterium]
MKIALVHPKIIYRCEHPLIQEYANHFYQDILSRAFNHNLLRLAALTPPEHEVRLIDESYERINFDEKFDVVALTAMTYQVERAYAIAEEFKKRHSCRTILGGIHATMLPQEAGQKFDSVCVGEVENVWEAYLQDAAAGHPQKTYAGPLADLDREPLPKYSAVSGWAKSFDKERFCFFPAMTSRGCPRGCEYCSATYFFDKKYRKKGIAHVLQEIREIKKTAHDLEMRNYHVEFCDDNFIIDRKRTKELLHALANENITYAASMDIAAPDDGEIMELLGSSGCKAVSIGLESLEVNILDDLGKWKKSQRVKVEKNIRSFFDCGIMPGVNFMVGSDGTDRKLFKNIRTFLREFPVLYNLSFFTPFPGTPYFSSLKKENRLYADKTWTDYNLLNLVFEPKNLSKEEMYEEFYSLRSDHDHMERYVKCLKYMRKLQTAPKESFSYAS